jgi:hypothetical protein
MIIFEQFLHSDLALLLPMLPRLSLLLLLLMTLAATIGTPHLGTQN